jgi:arsenite methyltransferase
MSDEILALRRRGHYGIDGSFELVPAPVAAGLVILVCAGLVALTIVGFLSGHAVLAIISAGATLILLFVVGVTLHTTLRGKFHVWARILIDLGLSGDERLLDLGCGRGAVLLAAAKLLPEGCAEGIDLWTADQTGNSLEATRRNAELEGVANRIALHTGDITQLPFDDDSFDVIVSSIVIHNIPTSVGRQAALDEAVRVLRPGGRLNIVDLRFSKQYAARLRALGLTDVQRRNLGWRFWWSGPWTSTYLVTARKPTTGDSPVDHDHHDLRLEF